ERRAIPGACGAVCEERATQPAGTCAPQPEGARRRSRQNVNLFLREPTVPSETLTSFVQSSIVVNCQFEMGRTILHVDMDAFYAAVDQCDRPHFRGKPVIVGADPKNGRGRGIVSTCSYESDRIGVHSAEPISKVSGLCP